MEYRNQTPQDSERIDNDQLGYYLPATPSESLVGVVQRLVGGFNRYDLDES